MIKLSKSVLLPISLSLIVAGCETATKRDCQAFFHPDYEKWAQERVNETLVFTDQNGTTESFDVTKIESSVPFQSVGFGSKESNVPCDLRVHEVLVGAASNETILMRFDHSEFSDRDLLNEVFVLRIKFSTGVEEWRKFDFGIDLRKSVSNWIESGFAEQIRLPELEIGGVLYQDVITQEILNERFLVVNPNQVRIVAIASGFGLVQYERVNGSVFSRVP